MDREILEALADVSEDLAIELTNEFTLDDFKFIGKSARRLMRAEEILIKYDFEVPGIMKRVLQLFREGQESLDGDGEM